MATLTKKPVEQVRAVSKVKWSVNGIIEHEHRTKMHQQRQAQCQSLRAEFGYMGDDDTVQAMHWLARVFAIVPSLGKWASTKTVNGRKPGPVVLKRVVMDWLCEPVNAKTRGDVYSNMGG